MLSFADYWLEKELPAGAGNGIDTVIPPLA